MELRNELGQTEKEFLDAYNPKDYDCPANTVDMLLLSVINGKLSILLIKRRNHPWINSWALPGGFVNINESLDEAVSRELKEETNATKANYFHQMYTLGAVDRDPRMRVITTAYLSLTREENLKNIKAGDDAKDAKWFTVSKSQPQEVKPGVYSSVLRLENKELGVKMVYRIKDKLINNYIQKSSSLDKESNASLAADHIKLINMAIDKCKHRVASSGLMFNLLPDEFTLKQAQMVYEAVSGIKKDTANFRRDILKMLTPTGNKTKSYNKEAELYRFNPLYSYLIEEI